jgi:RNA polymerase sigma factor for flagellar operon FliA
MMSAESVGPQDRVMGNLAFVESVARRVAASMPHTIDLGDLVQDGMLGLIDAANRFDDTRGIKFETFAERRVRGAMIDALRKDAWPRGIRRQRRELEAAREALRRELGGEPSLADLAARVGTDEARLGRTIVRINTIESTSTLAAPETPIECMLPDVCLPPESPTPDHQFDEAETREQVRRAIGALPPRERKVIALYYYREVTMKQIGAEIGVNESRVSQLHARAIQRLRKSLATVGIGAPAILGELLDFNGSKARMAKAAGVAAMAAASKAPLVQNGLAAGVVGPRGVVLPYPITSRAARSKSASRNGFGSQRQPDSSRKRSASVPATSPVTKITRRASAGELAAIAR